MYRSDVIKENLATLVGWRQSYDNSTAIDSSLTVSDSGQYYQDAHPLLTLDNIKAIAPEYLFSIVYPTWVATSTYKKGAKIELDGVNYICLIDNMGFSPKINPSYWSVFDAFSDWLATKTKASILKAIQTFYNDKLASKMAKNILEGKTLFDGAGRITDKVIPTASTVGFEIVPARAQGVTLRIDKIGLQFTGVGAIKLYLMHSSSKTPIKTIELTRTKDGSLEWFTPKETLLLPYQGDATDAGGSWYLCYSQNELPIGVQAISKNKDWSASPCAPCNRAEYSNWVSWSKYLEVHPFKVSSTGADFNNDFNEDHANNSFMIWNVDKNMYTYDTNYGINLQVSVECDITDMIIQQRSSFQNVIQLQLASDMIREMAYNPDFRINRMQQNYDKRELLYELDGDSQGRKSGILYNLKLAMDALKIDTMGMNRICLPCSNNGVRYRTA